MGRILRTASASFLATAVATGIRILLNPYLGSRLPFVLAIAVVAQVEGLVSGLVTSGLTIVIINSLAPASDPKLHLVLFGLVGIALSIFGGWRKRTEDQLRRTRYNLETAQQIANIGSWQSDVVGKLWWSPEIYNIFGVQPGKPLHTDDFFRLVYPGDSAKVREAVKRLEETGNFDIEHRIVRESDGEVRYVHQRAKAFMNGRVHLIGSIQDVTEMRRAEAEIKILRGLLPTCAYCKKIQTDEGRWQQFEVYVTEHSEARFSHGMCPDCCENELAKLVGCPSHFVTNSQ